ncbi:hypothetical protein SSX86_014499 [Deinandra increscens subsp. villosa]|uniref:FCP1 homology domain-containing protein n=1 Tax=Deinandra increscens subsp. villosa TaxID=3103831 RepID=A0AAP0D2D2_9ASTR
MAAHRRGNNYLKKKKLNSGIRTLAIMEVIMSSPVQECSRTQNDNGNGTVKLTKSQRKNRRRKAWKQKMKENLGLLEKREDIEIPKSKPEAQFYTVSPASLQGDLNKGIGTSITIDKNMAILSAAATSDEKSLKFKRKEGEMGSSMTTNLNGEFKVQKKVETTIGETSSGTSAMDNTNTSSKKRKRKKMNNNAGMGDILSTHESTQGPIMTKVLGVESNGTGSGKIATPDANMVSNGDHTEVASGKIGESETMNLNVNGMNKKKKKLESKNKQPTLAEILNPQYLQNLEAAKGATGSGATLTDKPASKKQKRQKLNTNPDLGDILSTHGNESTQEGLSTPEVLEVKSGETVSVKTATSDANMVLKGDHTVAVNGKMKENETSNLIVNGEGKKKKKRKPKKKGSTLGESLNPQSIENLEAAKHETGSSTTATDNPASEIQTRQKLNTNSDLDDILSTHESKQEGLSTTKVVEVKSGETVSGKTATSDANMVFKREDLTEVANGKMVESETTNLNVNNSVKKKNMLQSKNKRPTLGEILNPHYLQSLKVAEGETGSATTSKYNPASKEQKSQRLNKNPDLGDILSAPEGKQEGSSTTKAREIKSGETVSGKIAIMDANDVLEGEDHTVAANGKMQENGTNNLNVNGKGKKKKRRRSKNKGPSLGEDLKQQYIQNLEAAEHETGSGTTAADNPASKEHKKQKINNNTASEMLSTCENKQDKAIAKKDLSMDKLLEVVSGEKVSQGEEHMQDANGKTDLKANTNLNVSDVGINKNKLKDPISRIQRPMLGEILNPRCLELPETYAGKTNREKSDKINSRDTIIMSKGSDTAESGREEFQEILNGERCWSTIGNVESTMLKSTVCTQAFDGEASSSKKSKKRKNQDITIMNKGSSTAEPEGEDFQGIVNGEKCPSTIADAENTMLKSIECPQVAKSDMCPTTIVPKSAETADLEIAEADASEALSIKRQKMGVKEITQVATVGKKLLIFDVNGLLADIVSHRPTDIKADKYITRRSIFKRPYLDDFLCFCFEKFIVGIWSSRTMRNLKPVVDFLLGDLKKKLLFMWDGSKCTNSGIKTLEDKHKCLVVKDLRKIWDKDGPGNSWVKGTFHESNTLLVDDSPYKALLNPKYTGIFPASYSYKNRDDNFLGPEGNLRTYLEGLAAADDVKMYVEQHPFGQGAIDEKSPHWAFYSRVLGCLNGSEPLTRTMKKDIHVTTTEKNNEE